MVRVIKTNAYHTVNLVIAFFLTPFQSDYSSHKPNSQNASRALTSHALSSVVSARNIHSGSILNREDGGCSSGGVSESTVSH